MAQIIREHKIDSIIHFAASAIGQGSAWLLQEQHDQLAGPDRNGDQSWCAPVHLFIDLRGLRQSDAGTSHRGHASWADLALWLVQADDRNHAARRWHG